MAIVQVSDFDLNQNIPLDEVTSLLKRYINKYEPKIGARILGYELFKDFEAGLQEDPVPDKWTELLEGGDYTYNGRLERFDGLKDALVNFVYVKFTKEEHKFNSAVGVKKLKSENADNANPTTKMAIAYNEMVDIYRQAYYFIKSKNAEAADTYENYYPGNIGKITHFGF